MGSHVCHSAVQDARDFATSSLVVPIPSCVQRFGACSADRWADVAAVVVTHVMQGPTENMCTKRGWELMWSCLMLLFAAAAVQGCALAGGLRCR
jgi:hypothetical protein